MTRRSSLRALRHFLAATAAVLPLLGCIFGGGEAPEPVRRCDPTTAVSWTPERIEILDMDSEEDLGRSGTLQLVQGGQGGTMVGVYVVIYGDDIPSCVEVDFDLDSEFADSDAFVFEPDGPRRAQLPNPQYWVVDSDSAGTATHLSVTVGDLTVGHDVTFR